jgi:hypothetical protein
MAGAPSPISGLGSSSSQLDQQPWAGETQRPRMVRPHRAHHPSAEQQQNGMVSSTGIVNDLAAMARRIVLAITDIVAIIASDRISPVATYN